MKIATYTLPAYWASALINGDYSGTSEQDTADIDKFIEGNIKPGCRFDCIGCGDEQYFKWGNDATNLGGDVLEYTFDVSPY